jgi:hypothetical protein
MPRIGCGLAGGTWYIVEKILLDIIEQFQISIFVYDFVPKPKNHKPRHSYNKKKQKNRK